VFKIQEQTLYVLPIRFQLHSSIILTPRKTDINDDCLHLVKLCTLLALSEHGKEGIYSKYVFTIRGRMLNHSHCIKKCLSWVTNARGSCGVFLWWAGMASFSVWC